MSSPANPDPLLEEAGRWVIRHGRGPLSADEEAAFQAWQSADPRHRSAFERLQRIWAQMGHVDSGTLRRRLCRGRPRAAAAAILLASGLVVLFTPAREALLPLRQADYATDKGEIRRITLADGSIATLDADSAIRVHMDAAGRHIELLAGRAHFQVARQTPPRPFTVKTQDGNAEALGTRFDVSREAGSTTLSVFESRVRATCSECPADTPRPRWEPASGYASTSPASTSNPTPCPRRRAGPRAPWCSRTRPWPMPSPYSAATPT